jgi:hypothetical protein
MPGTANGRPTKQRPAAIADPAVAAVFHGYPRPLRGKLLALRRLILETAATTQGVGPLVESLKWGQPSYLTAESKSGSAVRIGDIKGEANRYAMFVHCQTDLVATFRLHYPKQLIYGGNRSVIFDVDEEFPEDAVRHCVALALTYHRNKRKPPR